MMASPLAASSSGASTPESPLAKAATTIDDLTIALSNFSRATTPDPAIICCCRRDNCESTLSWASFRAKLESRLVLSAEVGQALLQRHEAYVLRKDAALSREAGLIIDTNESSSSSQKGKILTKKLDTLTEENALMETRINELLIKLEVSEAFNKTIMRELQEARTALHRVSAQHTRSIGWEMRLQQQIQEKEDMRQERDSESHRAKLAESKAAVFMEKYSNLQHEVHALREELHNLRASRAEFSKSVLQEARMRLEALQHSLGGDHTSEDPETTRVLESLVADNETLKREIAELQNLLLESRDDNRTLRDELEEHRTVAPVVDDTYKVGTSQQIPIFLPPAFGRIRGRRSSNSTASGSSMVFELPGSPRQHSSPHISPTNSRNHRRSLSGSTFLLGGDAITEWHDGQHVGSFSPARLQSPSWHSGDINPERQPTPSSFSVDKYKADVKPPLLIGRSRGVQTDPQEQVITAVPSPRPSTLALERGSLSPSGQESHSDTSSVSQQLRETRAQSVVATLVEKVAGLLVKMIQADVRTLTNRLKRQHLLPPGSDARHLSRSTISGIVNEVANLRPPLGIGKDNAASNLSSLTVTRGDIKALLKLFKDAFTELGMLREQINNVVFDPSVAHRIRKEAIDPDPVKGELKPASAIEGWIAPIQKLFTSQPVTLSPAAESSISPAGTGKLGPNSARMALPRVAPKLAPAISASSMTVKVEFASSGVRKTETSDGSLRASSPTNIPRKPHLDVAAPMAFPPSSSRSLMGIFAGAPHSVSSLPPGVQEWESPLNSNKGRAKQIRSTVSAARVRDPSASNTSAETLGRSAMSKSNLLSRNVDAVIDQKDSHVPDFHDTLLQRTLRPRGLSDSSIHTTFLKDMIESVPEKRTKDDRDFLQGGATTITASSFSASGSQPYPSPSVVTHHDSIGEKRHNAPSSAARIGRHLASWATSAGRHFNDVGLPDEIVFGSPREDRQLHHATWSKRGLEGRDI